MRLIYQLPHRIAELTEKLEELRSEKAMLLSSLEYPEETGTEAIRKDISAMETGLQKLEQQEQGQCDRRQKMPGYKPKEQEKER